MSSPSSADGRLPLSGSSRLPACSLACSLGIPARISSLMPSSRLHLVSNHHCMTNMPSSGHPKLLASLALLRSPLYLAFDRSGLPFSFSSSFSSSFSPPGRALFCPAPSLVFLTPSHLSTCFPPSLLRFFLYLLSASVAFLARYLPKHALTSSSYPLLF
jgi:hypothetical protein